MSLFYCSLNIRLVQLFKCLPETIEYSNDTYIDFFFLKNTMNFIDIV